MKNYWLPIARLLLIGSFIATAVTPPQEFSAVENRVLTHRMIADKASFFDGSFTYSVEHYLSDQFIARQYWIDGEMRVKQWLGMKLSGDVFHGKDGFLLQRYQNMPHEQVTTAMIALHEFASSQPGKMAFLLAPTSCEVYKDKLPPHAPVGDENLLQERLMREVSSFRWIDVMSGFERLQDEELYFKTDHHWKAEGAYLATTAFLKEMGMDEVPLGDFEKATSPHAFYGSLLARSGFVDIEPDVFTYYQSSDKIKVDYHGEQDLAGLYDETKLGQRDQYAIYFGGNFAQVDIENPDSHSEQTLVLIKDSYGNSMVPFLIPHYRHITILDPRYTLGGLQRYMPDRFDHCLWVANAISFAEISWDKLF